jgi:hypothetical protein
MGATCINPSKKVLVLKSKRVIVKVSCKIHSDPGWSRSRNSDLRLREAGVGTEGHIFGSATLMETLLR